MGKRSDEIHESERLFEQRQEVGIFCGWDGAENILGEKNLMMNILGWHTGIFFLMMLQQEKNAEGE